MLLIKWQGMPEVQTRLGQAWDGGGDSCKSCCGVIDLQELYDASEDPNEKLKKFTEYVVDGKCESCRGCC